MYITDYCEKFKDSDYIAMIKKRFPSEICNKEIKVVGITIENSNYVNVGFYFENIGDLPEVLYTHIYTTELNNYCKNGRERHV